MIWKFVFFYHRPDKKINDHGRGVISCVFFPRLMRVQTFFPFAEFDSNIRKNFKIKMPVCSQLYYYHQQRLNWVGERDRGIFFQRLDSSAGRWVPQHQWFERAADEKTVGMFWGRGPRKSKNFVIKKWLNSAVKILDAPSENSPPVPTEKNSSEGFTVTRLVWKMFSLLHLVQKKIHSQPIWPLLWLQYLKRPQNLFRTGHF